MESVRCFRGQARAYRHRALGASGAIEAAVCCLAMTRGWIPPTINFETGDADCDLDYVAGTGRALTPRVAISNSFGFGGINASLVMVAPEIR